MEVLESFVPCAAQECEVKISHNSASSRPPALSAYRCWHSHAIATRCGRAISILALFAASLALAPVMLAQGSDNVENLSLEELLHVKIVTASKFSQSASDAPSAVTVITRDEIQKYGYRTLADLLQTVRGFYITYDRNYTYVGVRGFQRPGDYNSRVLLLIDGHRI